MNMLFTWSTENLCIVFPQWRITGFWSLSFSLLAVIWLTAGYEAVRAMSRKYEAKEIARVEQMGRK
jgi:copper transporter 1